MIMAGRWTRIRLVTCGVVFGGLFLGVAKRAYNLQVLEAEHLRTMAEEQYLREIELPPRRGRILDRNGAELASTADVDSIYCNPRRFVNVGEAARRLAAVLGLDRRELEKKLSQKRFFAWVKRKVTPDEVTAVKSLNLPGVAFTREPRRFYPNRTLAATVMGHAGSDGRGLDGVEMALDRYLHGSSSSVQGVRDALGRDLFVEGMSDAPNGVGDDVVLTIDRYLTFVTERSVTAAAARHRAKAVIAIMMDPRSGEVLAMTSVPTYNPNDPGGAALEGARNRAITDAFEPGSTMKTFTVAAALEAGVVRADDRFDCMMGRMMVGKYAIHDTHPYGVMTVAEIFSHSSNIGVTKIARRLGREQLAEALANFGFGLPTQIGLPGERAGIIRPVAKWGDIGFANVAFGQGLTVTPLQMVSAVNAIAGGGVYRQPRIVARIVRRDGTVEVPEARADRRVMSERAARVMTGIMRGVTETGGTARQAAIDGYPVAGKTGTAQKVSNGRYDPDKWVSSFVGFAPADDPRIALMVIVDEPQGEHRGGAVAAPIFKEIAEQSLRYLHVPPSNEAVAGKAGNTGGKGTPAAVVATDLRSAAAAVSGADPGDHEAAAEVPPTDVPLEVSLNGEDDLDGEWDAVAGAEGPRAEGSVPASVVIPNFAGMSLAEAIRAARRNGVELAFDEMVSPASGVAIKQKPGPGLATRGALCRVAFGHRE
ncbi:MAG TPA: penicillin-binding transpeptidase domain-containing protein [Polyangia bacterium]|jgi:cell division protein FtsI (penicillin-binding protein 3)|nr:penicillin-binding transpeptidase domain-containing protein [Polyangia bacterium]